MNNWRQRIFGSWETINFIANNEINRSFWSVAVNLWYFWVDLPTRNPIEIVFQVPLSGSWRFSLLILQQLLFVFVSRAQLYFHNFISIDIKYRPIQFIFGNNNWINILHVFSSWIISLLSLHFITTAATYIITLMIASQYTNNVCAYFFPSGLLLSLSYISKGCQI